MADDIRNTNELDWDSGLPAVVSESMPENYIPEEGEYGFTVRDMEKTFSKAGNKMAKLSIALDDQYHYKVTDYIVLTQAWKCAQFFEALGFKKKGVALPRMPWDQVPGAHGRLTIKHEEYGDKVYCKVSEYVCSEEEPSADTNDITPFDF
jgi:hypothetical protein